MKAKVKLIKKVDRRGSQPDADPATISDPREWSTAVKSWVTEFQKDRQPESVEAFNSLFSEPTS